MNTIFLIIVGVVVGWSIGILLGALLIMAFFSIKDRIGRKRYHSNSTDPLGDYIAAMMR